MNPTMTAVSILGAILDPVPCLQSVTACRTAPGGEEGYAPSLSPPDLASRLG